MEIKIIPVGPFAVNCSIVWGESKQAFVIDPGFEAEVIKSCLNENELTVAAYLLTHGHADHLSALSELHAVRPAPVVIHAEDYNWAFGEKNQIPPYYPVPEKPAAEFIHPERSNDWKNSAPFFQCLETPGHTRGGVCYWFEDAGVCFTGDTLFKGSCGRTDLPGGDGRVLAQSLKRLAALPPETKIIAGHGDETTIAFELKTNFFLQTPLAK
ncbi:MAG: MBL fold metallo-hydrolase [Verrucomicrobia bacterium]|nr:MBL fold metallo-hydrolase [Verrucomicrobiota bacterium]